MKSYGVKLCGMCISGLPLEQVGHKPLAAHPDTAGEAEWPKQFSGSSSSFLQAPALEMGCI